MKADIIDADAIDAAKDAVLVLDVEGGHDAVAWLSSKSKILAGQLSDAIKSDDFKFKDGQVWVCYSQGAVPAKRLVFAGLGKKEDFHLNKVRSVVASSMNVLRTMGGAEVAVRLSASGLGISDQSFVVAAVESALLASHKYDIHKSEKEPVALCKVLVAAKGQAKSLAPSLAYASVVASKTILARDLINAAASDKPPRVIAEYVKKNAGSKIKVSAFFKKDLEKMGARGILAVNRGSTEEPCLLVMEYHGGSARGKVPTVALVGKGIVFDSGGLDIKPASGMETMKGDMGGAAAVIHAAIAAAELDLPVHLVAISALTENLVGPDSYKPGDFIKTMSGKTIEVLNTDAEGRIVLADALHYAKSFKPDYLIDLATLTGACYVALGSECAGLFPTDDRLRDMLVKAGGETYERLWPMPMFAEYGEYIKSDFADLKNVVANGPSGGGAITAAKFLQNWVDNNQKWAHLDIAGVDWMEAEKDYRPKGATGFGVRLLVRFLADLSNRS